MTTISFPPELRLVHPAHPLRHATQVEKSSRRRLRPICCLTAPRAREARRRCGVRDGARRRQNRQTRRRRGIARRRGAARCSGAAQRRRTMPRRRRVRRFLRRRAPSRTPPRRRASRARGAARQHSRRRRSRLLFATCVACRSGCAECTSRTPGGKPIGRCRRLLLLYASHTCANHVLMLRAARARCTG